MRGDHSIDPEVTAGSHNAMDLCVDDVPTKPVRISRLYLVRRCVVVGATWRIHRLGFGDEPGVDLRLQLYASLQGTTLEVYPPPPLCLH